jgi:nicotinamide mononucleotide transporter
MPLTIMPISFIELLGTIIGLVYIFLEYRASWWLWIAGMVMSLFYIYIFYQENCIAWALIYLYYMGANIYGIAVWKKTICENSHSGISDLPKKYYFPLSVIVVSFTFILYFVLIEYTDTRIPVCESFSTALSVVGMYLLAKKYLQHWNVWIIVNPITALGSLYLGLYFSAILFAIYFVISIMGLVRWRKLAGK